MNKKIDDMTYKEIKRNYNKLLKKCIKLENELKSIPIEDIKAYKKHIYYEERIKKFNEDERKEIAKQSWARDYGV